MSSRSAATAATSLGPRIFQMGSAYLQGSDLATIARPHLEALRDAVGETAYLVMFSQGEIVQLCKADGKQAGQRRDPLDGARAGLLHGDRQGAALGARRRGVRQVRAGRRAAVASRRRRVTSKAELRREIAKVRESGFALDLEEFVPNLCCVAIPVRDHNGGAPLAAISIAMPKMRFKKRVRAALVRADAAEGGPHHAAARPVEN